MVDPRLVVFARAPRLGEGKRRLASDAGDVPAWRIARAMAAAVLRRVAVDPRWRTTLAVTPDHALHASAPGVWPAGLPRVPQGAGDLGDRLARVLARHGPTVVIGLDAPDVTAWDIASAFRALRRRALVFGPATDGGFWLIGVRGPVRPASLAHVRWSTPHALADTRAALANLGPPAMVRPLSDVDRLADWRARHRRP